MTENENATYNLPSIDHPDFDKNAVVEIISNETAKAMREFDAVYFHEKWHIFFVGHNRPYLVPREGGSVSIGIAQLVNAPMVRRKHLPPALKEGDQFRREVQGLNLLELTAYRTNSHGDLDARAPDGSNFCAYNGWWRAWMTHYTPSLTQEQKGVNALYANTVRVCLNSVGDDPYVISILKGLDWMRDKLAKEGFLTKTNWREHPPLPSGYGFASLQEELNEAVKLMAASGNNTVMAYIGYAVSHVEALIKHAQQHPRVPPPPTAVGPAPLLNDNDW